MKILLVGVGGYATTYVNALLENQDPSISWVGAVDPYFSDCVKKEIIEAKKIPVYATMEDFYREHSADLAIIGTPPFLHKEQSLCALSHGSYVLCEKPIAPTVEDAEEMIKAEKEYGKWIAIAYQWSFSKAIQDLKKDILSGILGSPVSFKTSICWPRGLAYYGRKTGWAGKISMNGVAILDSIASNACAHYLHNMFFLLGEDMSSSAEVDEFEAECFRANAIETFDTCSIKMKSAGIPLYFIASHVTKNRREPDFVYQFENATVSFYDQKDASITATFNDGTVKYYGNPREEKIILIRACINAIREGVSPICTPKTAIAHTKLIKAIHEKTEIKDFPIDRILYNSEENRIIVKGLDEQILRAYDETALLSEITE